LTNPVFKNKYLIMKIYLPIFLALFFFPNYSLFAQKLLQIEKVGSLKTQRYYIGDEVIFQLEGEEDDYWYRERIIDILVEANSVLFTNRVIKISSITKIRSFKDRGWSRNLSSRAFLASGAFVAFSLIGSATTEFMLNRASAIIPGATIIVGLAIRLIFRRKTYKIGKRRRLRVLDLNFYKIGP